MLVVPTSNVKILKCPLHLDNENQLTFSNLQAQINYFTSLPKIEEFDYTYVRRDNVLRVETNENLTYETLLNFNYVMYQNEGFNNKWFFAHITSYTWINSGLTVLTLEEDFFQSWQFDIIYKNSFIEREHVTDDTIGLHTIPENLELGDYICNEHIKDNTMSSYASDLCYIMASTSEPIAGDAKDTTAPSAIYNGIYTGLTYYRYDTTSAIDIILDVFAHSGKTDAINGIFMAPKWLAPLMEGSLYREVENSNTPSNFTINLSKQVTLNGYTPKNNKLLCYPYNYLTVSNNVGQNSILHYEKFSLTNATFLVRGVLNPSCSINITPVNYNGNTFDDINSIGLGKFPICNFQNDMYTNWLTQNSINILGRTVTTDDIDIISPVASFVESETGGGSGSITHTFSGVTNGLIQKKKHNMIPPSVSGQLNSGDVNTASGNNTFHFYKMSIKQEYARIIDDYFEHYGYRVNTFKTLSVTGRPYFNFVKTTMCEIEGDIPTDAVEKIKSLFNNGCTFWHDANNFLNYNVNNH